MDKSGPSALAPGPLPIRVDLLACGGRRSGGHRGICRRRRRLPNAAMSLLGGLPERLALGWGRGSGRGGGGRGGRRGGRKRTGG